MRISDVSWKRFEKVKDYKTAPSLPAGKKLEIQNHSEKYNI